MGTRSARGGHGWRSFLDSGHIVPVIALCLLLITSYGLYARQVNAHAGEAKHMASAVSPAPAIVYAQQPCTPVYAVAGGQGAMLAELLGGTDVTALERIQSNGVTWQHVRFWSGIDGYIDASLLGPHPPQNAEEGACEFPNVPDPQSVFLPQANGPWSLPTGTAGTLLAPASLYMKPDASSLPLAGIPIGTPVQLTAWAGDSAGHPWYQATVAGKTGWLWSGTVALNEPNPVTQMVNGHTIWSPVTGKGMWFTNYQAHHADINALVHAAKLAGFTHLYAEVAITQYGFYGQNTLDRLLPVAHAAGISVIAWVYPNLDNITADLRLTQAVAQYVTKSGDHADGIATDIEEVDDTASVYSYGQLVRALVGPGTLLVATVYHPFAQPYYPYAAIAASWNVIAPMDYWHGRHYHQYTADEVHQFVTDSITTIRAAMGGLTATVTLPVEELGQTYDMYSGDGTGNQAAPTTAEVTADMQTARALGCIGVSFFEWQTTTQQEWSAITSFQW